MKILSSVALMVAICASMAVPISAAGDKVLQNVKGDVTYQSAGVTKALAPNAAVSLANNDYAITGDKSLAAVSLPDSTRILVGAVTKVQLTFFDQQPNLTTATFVLYNGKTRFTVQHPAGARSSYTFQTGVGQIGVRGTEGDLSLSTTALQVNVYSLSDPNLPVVVTLKDGRVFQLHAGEALVVTLSGEAANSTSVSPILANSTEMMSTFCEFGGPGSNTAAALAEATACRPPAVASDWPLTAGAIALGAGLLAAVSLHGSPASAPVTSSRPPVPTPTPSPIPTLTPSPPPTPSPTPTITPSPTPTPTPKPTPTPTPKPTPTPTPKPTPTPTPTPTPPPTPTPSPTPPPTPSPTPTPMPTITPPPALKHCMHESLPPAAATAPNPLPAPGRHAPAIVTPAPVPTPTCVQDRSAPQPSPMKPPPPPRHGTAYAEAAMLRVEVPKTSYAVRLRSKTTN